MEGISCLMLDLISFPLGSVGGRKFACYSSGWEGLRRQSLYESVLSKTTLTPGSCFHRKSSGEDFGQSSLTILGLDANCKALVTLLKYRFSS